jgi:hypothetical protein
MIKRIIFIAVMCAFVAAPTFADLTPIDPAEGQSWSPGWYFTLDNIADHIQMKVSVAGGLETPSITSYGSPGLIGWSETSNNGTIAIWDTATDKIASFRVWFDDALKNQTFTWYLQSYNNGQLNPLDDNWFKFSNQNLVSYGGPPSGWNPGYVPVPGAVLLGMLGFCVAGLKLRKLA